MPSLLSWSLLKFPSGQILWQSGQLTRPPKADDLRKPFPPCHLVTWVPGSPAVRLSQVNFPSIFCLSLPPSLPSVLAQLTCCAEATVPMIMAPSRRIQQLALRSSRGVCSSPPGLLWSQNMASLSQALSLSGARVPCPEVAKTPCWLVSLTLLDVHSDIFCSPPQCPGRSFQ